MTEDRHSGTDTEVGDTERLPGKKRETLRRGATLSGLLHALVILAFVVSLPALWLWLKGIFHPAAEPVDWHTLIPVETPDDTKWKGGSAGPRGAKPLPEGESGRKGETKTPAPEPELDDRAAAPAVATVQGTEAANLPQTTPRPSGVERSAQAARSLPTVPEVPGALAVEIVRPEDVAEVLLPPMEREGREPAAGDLSTGADADTGSEPSGAASGSEALNPPSEGAARVTEASPSPSSAPAAWSAAEQNVPGAPARPLRPKGRDLQAMLDYIQALDPAIGDAMRRYHEAATQRETEDDVKTELEKRTEVADARAYARILKSARIGYAPAQFGAGIRALIGRGTEPDPTWAIDWLTKAANQNYVPAQRVLGFLHAKGIGTKQDLAKAYFWWTVATEAGDEVAKEGRELLNPLMTAQQLIEARKMVTQWKFIAAEAGFTQTDPAERRARAAELRQAAERGDVAQVRSLLTLGVDAQATDEGGKTALINAAWRGYGRVVEVMLEFGADPDFTDQNGLSALSWAALNGHTQVVEGLVAAGANINRRDNFGMTALMRAAWNGHRDTVAALVEAGADYTLTNNQRQSAIDLARSEGHVQIVELLQSRYRVRGGR